MDSSQGNTNRNFRQEKEPKTSDHLSTDNLVDFVQAQAIHYRQKELARITGLSLKQVQNLRMGVSGISGKTLTNWIKNCPQFAGAYAEYVGIIRPGEANMSEALTRLANAIARREA